jgi:FKBP-type peptidyl-prolyl cis-trans isomerase FkpA
MRKLIYPLVLAFCIAGCKKNNQAAIDQNIITSYISAHHLNATAEPNGLYFVPTLAGSGAYPISTSTVTIYFKGYLTNDSVFEETNNQPAVFNLSSVIPGWTEGIPLIQARGKGTLLIPSALGYGSQAQPGIPANSVLIYDVTLVSFQ